MPFQPVLLLEPFQKWGMDFDGPFKPTSIRTGNQYIIVATYDIDSQISLRKHMVVF